MDLNYAFVNLIGSSYALDVYPITRTNEMRIRIRPSRFIPDNENKGDADQNPPLPTYIYTR